MSQPWTNELIAIIIEMYQEGKSYSEIAKKIKRTRGSVSGKILRLRELGVLPKPLEKIKVLKTKPKIVSEPKYKGIPRPPTFTIKEEIVSTKGLPTLKDIKSGQCRFPVPLVQDPSKSMTCCGKPVFQFGASWCSEHRRMVFVPREKKPLFGVRVR